MKATKEHEIALLNFSLDKQKRNKFVGLLRSQGKTVKETMTEIIDEYLEKNNAK